MTVGAKLFIPPEGVCRICGEPMAVRDLTAAAAEKGYTLPPGQEVYACCDPGVELTIDDPAADAWLTNALKTYHAQVGSRCRGWTRPLL